MDGGKDNGETSPPKPKLTYLKLKGRAELSRYIFAAKSFSYEDHRISGDELQDARSSKFS